MLRELSDSFQREGTDCLLAAGAPAVTLRHSRTYIYRNIAVCCAHGQCMARGGSARCERDASRRILLLKERASQQHPCPALRPAMAAEAGIGCVLSPTCVVQSLKDGGAASSSGLILAGDRLEAIDGVRVVSDTQARPLILGAIGTRVTLSLDRNGTK